MQDQRLCDGVTCGTPGCQIPHGYCHCGCGRKVAVPKFVRNHDKRATGDRHRVDPETGCWIWLGYVNHKGYGQMREEGARNMRYSHVVYWERINGPIPKGLQLDHICHDPDTCIGGVDCLHRRCVNPDHLRPTTPRENNANSQTRPGSKHKPGRKKPAKPTHCKHGHEFTPENTILRKDGSWRCRVCDNATQRRFYYKRAAEAGVKPRKRVGS